VAIAADCVGARCARLVCTDGIPAAAQRTLLAQLAQAGARLRYHGDFDWAGLRIANHVMRTGQARPWRFMARDYEAAATDAPARFGPRQLRQFVALARHFTALALEQTFESGQIRA